MILSSILFWLQISNTRHMTIVKERKWSFFSDFSKFPEPFSKHACVYSAYNTYDKMWNMKGNTSHDEITKYAKLLIEGTLM